MDTIQNMLHRLKIAYIGELPIRIEEIENLVMALERKGQNESDFGDLFRQVHSLTGSGSTHGVQIITSICHPMEDYLSATQKKEDLSAAAFGNIAMTYVELMREAAKLLAKGQESFVAIETKLSALRKKAFAPQYSALVIETGSTGITYIKKIIDKFNCRMVLMSNGYGALGRALAEPFDLIITSSEIQELDGIALISAIKLAKGPNQHTKCILLTANSQLSIPGLPPDFILQKNMSMQRELVTAVKSIFEPA